MILEKIEESNVFDGVWMCLGEKFEKGERESAQKLAKFFFILFLFLFFCKMRGLGVFIGHF